MKLLAKNIVRNDLLIRSKVGEPIAILPYILKNNMSIV